MNAVTNARAIVLCQMLWALMGSGCHGVGIAADMGCIDPADYQRLAPRYADLLAKYDLPPIAQEFIDVGSDTQDKKAEVNACRKNASELDPQRCDKLAKEYDALASRLEGIQDRFYTALSMQEYLLTLKLTLQQPQCGK